MSDTGRTRLADAILQRADVVVLVADATGGIVYANEAVERLLGYPVDSVLGTGWWKASGLSEPEAQDERRRLAECATGQHDLIDEPYFRQARHADGSHRWLLWRDSLGPGQTVIGIAHDITDQRRLEEELTHVRRMEGLGRMAGGVAHDFNNLLTVIQGNARLLESGGTQDPEWPELTAEIVAAAEQGAGLVRKLLAFTRRQPLALRVVEFDQVVGDVLGWVGPIVGDAIELIPELGAGRTRVRVDPTQIGQAVLNLVVNARDACGETGRIVVRTAMDGVQHVVLEVVDDGVGMSAEVRERAFEPFFTTKPEGAGTGLGLSAVWGVVEQCQGQVHVDSEPGVGTTVRVRLPATDTGRLERAAEAAPAPAGDGDDVIPTVLVVEDNPRVARLTRRLLQSEGFMVLGAEDGVEALQLLRDWGKPIDVLLTDLSMPRMGGLELAARVREELPDAAVLLMSGNPAAFANELQALESGAHLIEKPYDPADLVARVRAAAR